MKLDKDSRHAGRMDILFNVVNWMKVNTADYAEFNSLVNWFEDGGFITARDNEILQAYWAVAIEGRDIEEVL